MKLFEMDGFLRGKCLPGDMKVNETNAEYLVRKFAEAESKCSALAAENAGMKQIIDSVTDLNNEPQYHAEGMGCGLEDRGITDRYDACRYGWDEAMERIYGEVIPCAEEIAFPATDAFLAEVRAQGLNAFIQHRSAELDAHIKNGGEQFDEKSVRIRDIIVSARLFREQIRKEAAQ